MNILPALLRTVKTFGTIYSYANSVVPKHNDVLYKGIRR